MQTRFQGLLCATKFFDQKLSKRDFILREIWDAGTANSVSDDNRNSVSNMAAESHGKIK